jgi:GR25 family glycosyltransferase involved in LPS biosynthesis
LDELGHVDSEHGLIPIERQDFRPACTIRKEDWQGAAFYRRTEETIETNDDAAEAGSRSWDFFDRFYCISLSDRKERRREAERELARIGLRNRVEFVIADRHPRDPEEGIFASHMTCIRKGLAAGARSMAIFEDDVVFDRFRAERLDGCVEFLASNPGWNLFFFGCLVKRSRKTENRSVLEVSYRCLAHAYAVSRPFAEALSEIPWDGTPFDAMLSRHAEGVYAAYPAFAFQSGAPSDNTRLRALDRFRRWCGGLMRIQKTNEFYHRNRKWIIPLHFFIPAAILYIASRAIFR